MFVSVRKGLFDKKVEEEINNSFKLIDDKIDNSKIPDIDEEVKVKKIDIKGSKENWSVMIGNQIVIFFRAGSETTSIQINKSIAPLSNMTVRALTEVNQNSEYYSASINTNGEISISEHNVDVIVYITYILANNPFISK